MFAAMTTAVKIEPRSRRSAGEACCEPHVYPEVDAERAERLAQVAKALGDPTRLQLVDVLRRHAGRVCVCELVPLFDMSQQALSQHLKKLMDAGVVGREKRGIWSFYYVNPDALEGLNAWLS
jgi:ArsR family transcriptional regulator